MDLTRLMKLRFETPQKKKLTLHQNGLVIILISNHNNCYIIIIAEHYIFSNLKIIIIR